MSSALAFDDPKTGTQPPAFTPEREGVELIPAEYAEEEVSEDGVDSAPEAAPAEPVAEQANAQEPVTEEAPPQAEAAPAEEFDATILTEAERYGFTAEAAKAFGSRDVLEQAMIALDRQAAAFGREQLQQQQPAQAEAQPEPPKAEPAQPAQQPTKQSFEKYKIALDPNEYDEQTIKELNGINDHYDAIARAQDERFAQQEQIMLAMAEALQETRQGFQQFTGRSEAEGSAQFTQSMDTFFAGLGEEFRETFGAAPVAQLTADAPQLINRRALVEEMRALAVADQYAQRPQQAVPELAQRALRVLHSDKLKTAARKELLDQSKQRRSQTIARPSGHNGKPLTPEQRAYRWANDFVREHAVHEDDLDDGI